MASPKEVALTIKGEASNSLRPGMELAVELFEILLIHMGVDLGRADVGVAKHCLDEPEVCPPF